MTKRSLTVSPGQWHPSSYQCAFIGVTLRTRLAAGLGTSLKRSQACRSQRKRYAACLTRIIANWYHFFDRAFL
jgi:hypothetical protein